MAGRKRGRPKKLSAAHPERKTRKGQTPLELLHSQTAPDASGASPSPQGAPRGALVGRFHLVGWETGAEWGRLDRALSGVHCLPRCLQVTSQPLLPATSQRAAATPRPAAAGPHPACTAEAAW